MYEVTGGSAGVRFAQGITLLDTALDLLSGVDMTEVEPHGLGDHVLGLMSAARRLGGVQAAVADRFATSGAWVQAGAKSARAWIASQSNEPIGRAGAVITTGARMRAHVLMGQAFLAGEVSATHVEILATTAKKYPSIATQLAEVEDSLVDIARLVDPHRFAAELTAICHALDPAAVETDERQRDAEAYLHLSPLREGMWRVDGLLPSEVGHSLRALLDAAGRRLRAEATQAEDQPDGAQSDGGEVEGEPEAGSAGDNMAGALNGDREVVGIDVMGNPIYADEIPAAAMDARYGSRRNVDALRLILALAAPATNSDGTIALPSVNGARPVVHLTMDIDTLLAESDATTAGWIERFGVPDTVISAAKAQHLACDSRIEPMIVRDGQLIATLPSLQTVPAHLRKAVIMRDRKCRIWSCTSAIHEIHHLVFLSQGGPTTTSNLAGLCWFHHHLIHHGNWTLTGDANEELTLTNTSTGSQWRNRPPKQFEHRGGRNRRAATGDPPPKS